MFQISLEIGAVSLVLIIATFCIGFGYAFQYTPSRPPPEDWRFDTQEREKGV